MVYKWRTVVIGTGHVPPEGSYLTNTPLLAKGYKTIGENEDSYWIHDLFHDKGMTIYKDTYAGKTIKKLMNMNETEENIKIYLQKIFIQNVQDTQLVEIFNDAIDAAVEDAFERGQKDKAAEFQKVIGL